MHPCRSVVFIGLAERATQLFMNADSKIGGGHSTLAFRVAPPSGVVSDRCDDGSVGQLCGEFPRGNWFAVVGSFDEHSELIAFISFGPGIERIIGCFRSDTLGKSRVRLRGFPRDTCRSLVEVRTVFEAVSAFGEDGVLGA